MNALSLILILMLGGCLINCTGTPVDVADEPYGYVSPPADTSVSQELKQEYARCMRVNKNDNCAQQAYDIVRRLKGLEPLTVPKGIVTILREGGVSDE